MPPGLLDFLKKNAKFAFGGGLLGAAMVAGDVKGILDADNKFKALLKTFKDFVLVRIAVAGVFTAIGSAIKSLVRDTGSLEAALKKLGQMQVFVRQMQTLLGGLQTARQRVAALAVLSERGLFKFDDLIAANKNLQVFTRGAYSSVEATKQVGEAAIATGNSVEDVARAVGAFYDRLRSGAPVRDVAEQLREMGVITQSTADDLTALADSGVETATVFNRLTEAMQKTAQGAEGYKTELQSITEEHQKAINALQEKFAAPWTESETRKLSNYTEATKAFTPAVESMSKTMATVYNSFSTFTSGMVKWAAQSKIVQGIATGLTKTIVVLGVVALAFGVKAATEIVPALLATSLRLMAVGTAASVATGALTGLAGLAIGATLVGGIVTVIGAVVNLRQRIEENKKAFKEWNDAQIQAQTNLAATIAAVTTLTEKNEAYAKGLERLTQLEKERVKNAEKHRDTEKEIKRNPLIPGRPIPALERAYERFTGKRQEEDQERRRAKQIEKNKTDTMDQMETLSKSVTINKDLVEAEARRRNEIEQSTKGIEQRDQEAMSGLHARQQFETATADIDQKKFEQETQLVHLREKLEKTKDPKDRAGVQSNIARTELQITDLARQRNDIAAKAPAYSAVALEAEVDRLQHAKQANILEAERNKLVQEGGSAEKRRQLATQIGVERAAAGGRVFTQGAFMEAQIAAQAARQREANAPGPEAVREVQSQTFQLTKEIEEQRARSRGDVRTALRLEDLMRYTKTFEQLRPAVGEKEAQRLATEKTKAEIGMQYAQAGNVVGYLQSIGGGGGLPQQGVDLQRRMVELLSSINEYNKVMAGGQPNDQQQQQTPAFFFNP